MKRHFILCTTLVFALLACKKEDASPTTSSSAQQELKISLSKSFDSIYVNETDTIEIIFEAKGKDYVIDPIGEKGVFYPNWNIETPLCDIFTPFAFKLEVTEQAARTTSTQFTLKKGETISKKVIFYPRSFSYNTINGFTQVCYFESCFDQPNCQSINSNGIGYYKSDFQFTVNGTTRNVTLTAKSIQKTATEIIAL
jgi:hypothetical protein